MRNLLELIIVFRGAGDLASGAGLRLYAAGLRKLLFLEIPQPVAVRRTVSFSEAVYDGCQTVENVRAVRIARPEEAPGAWDIGAVAVLVDPGGTCLPDIRPDVVVEATLAKRNVGVRKSDAPLVIGLGPGFVAGQDVHCVVETQRGATLGRVLWEGAALPNTGIPGPVEGYTLERVLRAPAAGRFTTTARIGAVLQAGTIVGQVEGVEVRSGLKGVLRGLLRSGIPVSPGMKLGDVDPRPQAPSHLVSEKSLALGGGILEAIMAVYLGTSRT